MISFVVGSVLVVFSVWLFFRALGLLFSLVASPTDIVLVPFDASSDEQKKLATAVLSSNLQQLQTQGRDVPSGYGFLNVRSASAATTPRSF